jgi:hypothetical protein
MCMCQSLGPHQRVNQFPRSFEVTRKDTLARNMGRMKQLSGERHFAFFPTTFVLPRDHAAFTAHLATDKEVRRSPSSAEGVLPSPPPLARGGAPGCVRSCVSRIQAFDAVVHFRVLCPVPCVVITAATPVDREARRVGAGQGHLCHKFF